MAVPLSFLLILTGLTGAHSVTTVSEVSVKVGGSIAIPCLYESKYMDNVKYLCGGYYWNLCKSKVKTNELVNRQRSSEKFSISDAKKQRIFTVTIKHLTYKDANYWCIVEIDEGTDVGQYFHLSVTAGTPNLYVDHQGITGFIGESISISCSYRNSGEKSWCRLNGTCVIGSSGSIDGTKVTISATFSNVFTVTMSELTTESSGWYYCVKGNFQMPVHVTVTKRPKTTSSVSPPPTSEPVSATSVSLSSLEVCCSVATDQKRFIIPLCVLIILVMVILSIWFMWKKTNTQTDAVSSPTTTAEEEVKYSSVKHRNEPDMDDEQVIYASVDHTRGALHKGSDAECNGEVIYSPVVQPAVTQQAQVEEAAACAMYSTVAKPKQNL